jgi:hypothetical protein
MTEDDLIFDLAFALRSKTAAKVKDETAARIAAKRIADHLKLCGWRFEHDRPRSHTDC